MGNAKLTTKPIKDIARINTKMRLEIIPIVEYKSGNKEKAIIIRKLPIQNLPKVVKLHLISFNGV